MARLAVSLCSGGRFGLKEEELRQVGPGYRPVATAKVPLQVVSQLTGLDTLVTFRRRIQASCSTAFLCPLHPAHRDILAVILQGGSGSCCADCADQGDYDGRGQQSCKCKFCSPLH